MIRKNSLFCKLVFEKTPSKSIFEAFMRQFRPELETCPFCGAKHSCRIHAYYNRYIVDLIDGRPVKESVCILRVICESCGHTHAILPDIIIPYSGFSVRFVLFALARHFLGHVALEDLSEEIGVSLNQLHKWISVFRRCKRDWLGLLDHFLTPDHEFLRSVYCYMRYSDFSMRYTRISSLSFLQSHKNPAHYCQTVFGPDLLIT